MQFQEINKRVTNTVKEVFDTKAVRITQIVVVLAVVGLVIWDVYLYFDKDETISSVIRKNAVDGNLFVIIWVWGILASHLFIAQNEDSDTIPEVAAILVLLLISILIFLLGRYIDSTIILPQYMQIILLIFGGICGYFLWPQKLENQNPKN